jgi:tripartite-type tricarboxylate transporter receptor subunit TctC
MMKILVALLTLLAAAHCLAADAYPSQPVRLIVPFEPGGGADLIARLIAPPMSEQLGKQVVIDNRGGAGGRIGTEAVARASPAGYVLLLGEQGFVTNPAVYKTLPYNVQKDFTPISHFLRDANALVVSPDLNVTTLAQFIALARANPGKYNYGASAIGSFNQLTAELFKQAAKVNLVHVAYSGGGGEAITALSRGEVHMLFTSIPTVVSAIKSGRIRALAVSTDSARSPVLPDVPTMAEAGLPGMSVYSWNGIIGPANMPKEVVTKLHEALAKGVATSGFREKYEAAGGGSDISVSTPEQFSAYLQNELKRWTDVVKAANIAVDP